MAIRKLWKKGRLAAIIGLLVIIGLGASGCVQGLAPIGWSGGAAQNGKIFVGARDGTLTAITLTDNSRQKAEALKAQASGGLLGCSAVYGGGCSGGSAGVAIYGTPAFADDLVFIGGYNGKVYAYNTENLAVRWVYPREGYLDPIVGSVVTDGEKLYFGDTSGTVYALDTATGDLAWSRQTGDKVWGTAAADGTVYIGSFDKKLYALDAADGGVKWTFDAEGSFIATPVVQDGVVYVGAFDRNFYAIDAATGSRKWSFRAGNWFWSQAVIVGDTVYAASLDGTVYALRLRDGGLVTSYDLGAAIASAPEADGTTVVVANNEGVVYKIDTASGRMSTLATLEKTTVDGPILLSGGAVYIQNSELQLVKIDIANGAISFIPLTS